MVQEIHLEKLDAFAEAFWREAGKAVLFAFHGEMGAGKTTIISALCRRKGVKDPVSSPTFSIINEYGFEANGKEKIIYHIDLYRLNGIEEIIQTGVEECLRSGEICLVEWPEKAPELFDEQTVHVTITALGETSRQVQVHRV